MAKRKRKMQDQEPIPTPAPTPHGMRYKFGEGVPPLDWKAMPEGKEKYQAYLCSREWAEKRNAVHERCSGICERCGLHEIAAVHHLTYANKYNEPIEELAGWCQACHDFTHAKSTEDPRSQWDGTMFVVQLVGSCYGDANVRDRITCPICRSLRCHISTDFALQRMVSGELRGCLGMCCEAGHLWRMHIKSDEHGGIRIHHGDVRECECKSQQPEG